MESKTAKKKFCSALHRVYWNREKEKGTLGFEIVIKNNKPEFVKYERESVLPQTKSKGIIETIREQASIITVDKDYNTEVFENQKAFDNSEIKKQIEAVKNETKPSWIAKSQFERYQNKKIAELQLKMK